MNNMTRKEMMTRCLEALGLDATQKEAEAWLAKAFGVKIGEPVFYTTRKELREKKQRGEAVIELTREPGVLPREPLTQSVPEDEPLSYLELRRVVDFMRQIGGEKRLLEILDALRELGVS